MRQVTLSARGRKLVFNMPELAAITRLLSGKNKSQAMRAFVKSCADNQDDLRDALERASAMHFTLAESISKACGLAVELDEVTEDDIQDQAMAKAYVEIAKREAGSKLSLHPVMGKVGPVQLRLIMRDPTEREVDDHVPNEDDAEACKALVETLTCWGDLSRLDDDAPGLWVALARFAMRAAGLREEVIVGEV